MADKTVSRSPLRTSAKDLTGDKFGRLTPIEPTTKRERGYIVWRCRCDCGAETMVSIKLLKSGNTRSCGCLKLDILRANTTVHGEAKRGARSHEYAVWNSMRERCLNATNPKFHRYGGRGIAVCERWNMFELFRSDMGQCPPGMSLERIDNNGGYSPDNCKWATRKEQQRNTVRNRMITSNGVTLCVAAWA